MPESLNFGLIPTIIILLFLFISYSGMFIVACAIAKYVFRRQAEEGEIPEPNIFTASGLCLLMIILNFATNLIWAGLTTGRFHYDALPHVSSYIRAASLLTALLLNAIALTAMTRTLLIRSFVIVCFHWLCTLAMTFVLCVGPALLLRGMPLLQPRR
jgi:hypothetical protein